LCPGCSIPEHLIQTQIRFEGLLTGSIGCVKNGSYFELQRAQSDFTCHGKSLKLGYLDLGHFGTGVALMPH